MDAVHVTAARGSRLRSGVGPQRPRPSIRKFLSLFLKDGHETFFSPLDVPRDPAVHHLEEREESSVLELIRSRYSH